MPHRGKHIEFLDRFHAFCEYLDAQFGRDHHQAPHDRLSGLAVVYAPQQLHIDLKQIGLELGEQSEAGVARAEIV